MTYIGIDQSLSNFAAVALSDGEVHSTLLVKSGHRGARRLRDIQLQFLRWLDHLVGPVQHICMEGYANGSKFGREAMGEVGGLTKITLIEFFGEQHRVSYPTIVQPLQVKQFAGDTKAKKEDLKLLTYKKWGFESPSNDIVDAFILAKIAQGMEEGADLVYEKSVLTKLLKSNEF